ncbi:hypothetical protein N7495_008220 [Penicillium taxi]|uniref:uncharacterized protein n=1 Tax=Penicillium taxi TaxID=168475 RepID=UPI0025453E8C|nr:uncharacterized protein N7495_008220 [Penicillium taxi]KAJ5888179.1 hypothetical protein N7495_008220 [Penicillium taxi]
MAVGCYDINLETRSPLPVRDPPPSTTNWSETAVGQYLCYCGPPRSPIVLQDLVDLLRLSVIQSFTNSYMKL